MIEDVKIMLGNAADNFSDSLINLLITQTTAEVEAYCNRALDEELTVSVERLVVIKLLRIGSEGLNSQSYSGISESYVDGIPADIQAVLNRKRKVKLVG